MKRKLNKIRVKTLKAITWLAGIMFILAGCCLDNGSDIPLIICLICASWLFLMFIANGGLADG